MGSCTNLPSDISHLIGVIGIYEAVRRGVIESVEQACSTMQNQLESHIGEVTVASSVVHKTTENRRTFWAPRAGAIPLPQWIRSLGEQQASVELALFETGPSEMPRWVHVAFANSGSCGLAVTTRRGSTAVRAIWQPNDPKKQYDIDLKEVSVPPCTESKPLNESYSGFLTALDAISDFARRSERYEFLPVFESVETALKTGGDLSRYTEAVMREDVFSPGAIHLFDALDQSWIFGGMGSWTDIILRDPNVKQEYDTVTAYFYDALMQAILSVANKGRE